MHRYFGESENKTKSILDATKGKVLVINEVYMLRQAGDPDNPHSYDTAVIDTIIGDVHESTGFLDREKSSTIPYHFIFFGRQPGRQESLEAQEPQSQQKAQRS